MTLLTTFLAVITINGIVVDAKTQTPVADALVVLPSKNESVLAAENGRFSLEVEPGRYFLVVMAEGYRTLRLLDTPLTTSTTELRIPLTRASGARGSPLSDYRVGEIPITGSRLASRTGERPREVVVLDAADIRDRLPAGTPEVLQETPEVLVQKTSLGGGSPIIRGLSGNRVLLLVDGVRLNNSTYRVGLNQYLNTVDPGIVERVETLFGAGSALYGSDALGGVVQVITAKPTPLEPRVRYAGRLTAAEGSTTHSLRLTRWWPGGGFLVGGGYRRLNDLRGGGSTGIQKPTGYREWSANTHLLLHPDPTTSLTCAYQLTRQSNVPRTDRVVAGKDLLHVYDPQHRELLFLRYETSPPGSWMEQARLTASWNHQREGRRIVRSSEPSTRQEFLDDVHTFGLSAEARAPASGGPSVVCGAEAYYDAVSSTGEYVNLITGEHTRADGKFPEDGEHLSTGLFAQADIPFSPELSVSGAFRFSSFHLNGTPRGPAGRVSLDHRVVTGSLHGSWRFAGDELVFLGVSQAFRAPNMEDALSAGLSNKGFDVPNPNLGPERTLSLEAGLKPGGRASSQRALSVTAYLTLIEDLIERAPTTFMGSDSLEGAPVFHQENQGRGFIYGFSGHGRLRLAHGWTGRASLAYTYGRNSDRREPLTRIPPLRGHVSLRCARGRTWTEIVGDWSLRQDRLSPDDMRDTRIPEGGTPAYFVTTLRGGVVLGESWSLRAALENIFDAAYRIHGSGIDMPGRNLTLNVEWKHW